MSASRPPGASQSRSEVAGERESPCRRPPSRVTRVSAPLTGLRRSSRSSRCRRGRARRPRPRPRPSRRTRRRWSRLHSSPFPEDRSQVKSTLKERRKKKEEKSLKLSPVERCHSVAGPTYQIQIPKCSGVPAQTEHDLSGHPCLARRAAEKSGLRVED